VLDPDLAQPEALGEAVGAQQRRPAGGQRAARRRALERQEVAVAPDRVRSGLDAAAQLVGVEVRARGVRHFERAEAALTDVARVERICGLALLAGKRLWRHRKNLRRGLWQRSGKPLVHISQACWGLLELAPFPCGW